MSATLQDVEQFRATKIDAVGEIENITMGSAATAVSTLLNAKVWITTPQVDVCKGSEIVFPELEPAIHVRIEYVEGINGFSLLILKQNDVQMILNQLMGLPLVVTDDFEFDEINISAVCEVMNQMMGASATALSEILGTRIDISTPKALVSDGTVDILKEQNILPDDYICTVTFSLTIDGVINSKFVTLLDIDLASEMADMMLNQYNSSLDDYDAPQAAPTAPPQAAAPTAPAAPVQTQKAPEPVTPTMQYVPPEVPPYNAPPPAASSPSVPPMPSVANAPEYTPPPPQPQYTPPQPPQYTPPPPPGGYPGTPGVMPGVPGGYPGTPGVPGPMPGVPQPMQGGQPGAMPGGTPPQYYYPPPPLPMPPSQQPSNPLAGLDTSKFSREQIRNLQLLMSVPMDVSIEVGSTTKRIDEILDFSQGTVFELDRPSNAPVDIVVNGILIAKGEVVVVDDNFAIMVMEIFQTNMNDLVNEQVSGK